jgi:hypothetical protein
MSDFNKTPVLFELKEARLHLDELISNVEGGEFDQHGDFAFLIGLQHIYEHLNMSWHTKFNKEIGVESQQEYETLSSTFPNFFSSPEPFVIEKLDSENEEMGET